MSPLTPIILSDGRAVYPVHYQYRPADGSGKLAGGYAVACMPHASAEGPGKRFVHRSEDWRAVNCPWCKQSEEYKRASGQAGR